MLCTHKYNIANNKTHVFSLYCNVHLSILTSSHHTLQITDEKKLSKTSEDDLHEKFFADATKAKKYVNLIHFEPFADTADAVTAAAACIDGKVSKSLKSFLKKQLKKSGEGDSLAILDKTMVSGIKEAIPNLSCSLACDAKTHELFRGIRCYLDELMDEKASNDDDDNIERGDEHNSGLHMRIKWEDNEDFEINCINKGTLK